MPSSVYSAQFTPMPHSPILIKEMLFHNNKEQLCKKQSCWKGNIVIIMRRLPLMQELWDIIHKLPSYKCWVAPGEEKTTAAQ